MSTPSGNLYNHRMDNSDDMINYNARYVRSCRIHSCIVQGIAPRIVSLFAAVYSVSEISDTREEALTLVGDSSDSTEETSESS